MLLSLIWIGLCCTTGIALLKLLTSSSDRFVTWVCGSVLGILVSSWVLLAFASLLETSVAAFIVSFLQLGIIGLAVYTKPWQLTHRPTLTNTWAELIENVGLVCWWILVTWIFSSHLLAVTEYGWMSAGGAWGDMALHATFIHQYAYQPQLSLESPILANSNTNYPFMINWWTAVPVRFGSSIQESLLSTSVVVFALFLAAWKGLATSLSKLKYIAVLSVSLWFCLGGVGLIFFLQEWSQSTSSFLEFTQMNQYTYGRYTQKGVEWSNVVTDLFIPQRGFLIGITTVSCILWLQNLYRTTGEKQVWILSCVLLGLLPLFHTHSFLIGLGFYVWWGAHNFIQKQLLRDEPQAVTREKTDFWTSYGFGWMIVLVLALPQLAWISIHTAYRELFLQFVPGWYSFTSEFSVLFFWFLQLGCNIFWPYMLMAVIVLRPKFLPKNLRLFTSAALVLLGLGLTFQFQPFLYDNLKLLLPACGFLCIAISHILLSRFTKPFIIFIFIICGISGLLSIVLEGLHSMQLASIRDIQQAKVVKDSVPPSTTVLISPDHNHPVTMIAGRSAYVGYPGWLWTHGIDVSHQVSQVELLYTQPERYRSTLTAEGITYVVITHRERSRYPEIDEQWFELNWHTVANVAIGAENIKVFRNPEL